MEEKKGSKNGLLIVLLILAIIVICAMGYFIYKLNDDKEKATEQVSDLENKISSLESSVMDLRESKKNETKTKNKAENKTKSENKIKETKSEITDISVIEELLKNTQGYKYLRVKSIKEDDDKYLVEADYYVPTPISEKEYDEMVNNQKITLRNKEYVFEDNDDAYNPGFGYIYILGQATETGYWIEKEDDGYIFIHEIGGVYDIINEITNHYTFYIDKDTEVTDVAEDGEEEKLEEYLTKPENKDLGQFFTQLVYSESANNSKKELIMIVDKR